MHAHAPIIHSIPSLTINTLPFCYRKTLETPKMFKWDKPNQTSLKHNQFHSKNPTFSSSFPEQFNPTPIKTHQADLKNRGRPFQEDKMPPLPKPPLAEKRADNKVNLKVNARRRNSSFSSPSSPELDLQDTLFFSSSETDHSVFHGPKPPSILLRPKIDANYQIKHQPLYCNINDKDKEVLFVKTRSRARQIYSNLKNLKQPVSPGARLASLISSLFVKEAKPKKSGQGNNAGGSTSCLSRNSSKKSVESGVKRAVKSLPVTVITGEDSNPSGRNPVFEYYEEQRKKMEIRIERAKLKQKNDRQLEEMALDSLNGYWDSKLNVSHNQMVNNKVNHDYYGLNHDDDDDGISCSSSDLFELDHLSLIGDELPVYETTHF